MAISWKYSGESKEKQGKTQSQLGKRKKWAVPNGKALGRTSVPSSFTVWHLGTEKFPTSVSSMGIPVFIRVCLWDGASSQC